MSDDRPLINELEDYFADLLKFREMARQREKARDPRNPEWNRNWQPPPEMEELRQQLIRRSGTLQPAVERILEPRFVGQRGYPQHNIWNAALEDLTGLPQSRVLEQLGNDVSRAIARLAVDPAHHDTVDDVPAHVENTFRQEGEFWTLVYGRKRVHVKPTKGVAYIAYLLARQGNDVEARDLRSEFAPKLPTGRDVRTDSEHARQSVSRAVTLAISNIRVKHEALGAHLDAAIHRGKRLAYRPTSPIDWQT